MSIDFCFFLILLRKYAKVLYLALSDDEALQVTGSGRAGCYFGYCVYCFYVAS